MYVKYLIRRTLFFRSPSPYPTRTSGSTRNVSDRSVSPEKMQQTCAFSELEEEIYSSIYLFILKYVLWAYNVPGTELGKMKV